MTAALHPVRDADAGGLPPPVPTGTTPAPSEAVDSGRSARWDLEVGLAALTVAGLVGFHRVFTGTAWVGPVFGTALGVQLVCRLTRRWMRSPILAQIVDVLAVAVLTVWTVVPSSTAYGLPWRGSWHAVQHSLTGIVPRMDAATVPAHLATGFAVLAAVGAGVVALSGSWLTFRYDRTLAATFPSLGVFVACCILGSRLGRDWAVALEVIAVPAFVLLGRLTELSGATWFASRRTKSTAQTLRGALPGMALAAIVALAIVPSLRGPDGHGPLGWRAKGADSPRIVISPLVSLATRLLHQSTVNVFTVRSPVQSYWRLTSLDYFDGTEWNARDTYEGVDQKLPGVTVAPRGTRVVREQFAIQQLDSVWLPLAFDPESVTGAGRVSYDPRSGSLLTAHETSDHLQYTVTSLQYLASLSARGLSAAPPLSHNSSLAPYLQLPASIPAEARRLAQQIVAGKKTEYAKAVALQQFFHGPSFTYSLHPPTDGAGTAALTTFLFQTRSGYCQQFAGAYAVLARAVGLPTRLAIGFTAGRMVNGVDQVTDADAHTWPEVWFPSYGWVPFEPTKGSPGAGFSIPGASAYTGDTAATSHPGAGSGDAISTVPVTPPSSAATTSPQRRGGTALPHGEQGFAGIGPGLGGGSGLLPPTSTASSHHGASPVLAVLGGLVVALILLVGVNELGRRLRWARRRRRAAAGTRSGRRSGPDAIAVIWDEAAERLAWHGIRRRASETPRQFAARVTAQRRADNEVPFAQDLHRLATLVDEAGFAPDPLPQTVVEEAERRGRKIAAVLARGRSRPERWTIRLDPRLAWSPRTVEPCKPVWVDVTLG